LNEWQHITNLPGPVTALGYTVNQTLVLSGADFSTTWHAQFGTKPLCVSPTRIGIGPVACHPRRNLVAYATLQGGIFIGPPGSVDAMEIRDAGVPITLLAFSPDGEALAFAADDGEAGTVMLPDILFRAGETR
jgi:hypothetical protein